jgi:hypothetical protein
VSLIVLPTDISLPTKLDDLRADYIAGRIDVHDFEDQVERALADGTANDVAPWHGMALTGEWR